ncbi:MAG: SpoIIE family protein phosphatase [Verrucomicrobiota bacterium]
MNASLEIVTGKKATLPAQLDQVPLLVAEIVAYSNAHGLDIKEVQGLELLCTEAINNAVEHGAREDASQKVSVRWEIEGQTFTLEVEDPSDFLPELNAKDLPEDPLSERGRGSCLIDQLSDSAAHYLVGGKHRLLLTKRLEGRVSPPESVEDMDEMVNSMTEELSTAYENLSALFRLGERLATSGSFQKFVDSSLQELMELTQSDGAMISTWKSDQSTLETIGAKGVFSECLGNEQKESDDTIEVHVARHSEERSLEAHETVDSHDPFSAMQGHYFSAPMSFADRAAGVLTLHRTGEKKFFSTGQTHLARTFTDFLSIVITLEDLQVQRAQQEIALREIEIAGDIQKRLLPRTFPQSKSYLVSGACNSARQVGGDYLDAISVDNESVLLVIADVMGKGVPAAMLATIFRTALYSRLEMAADPGALLTGVAAQLYHDIGQLDMFITAQIVYCDGKNRTLLLANAGHSPAVLWNRSREYDLVEEGGVPLGILDGQEYIAVQREFPSESRLMLFTDGLYEVQDKEGTYLNIEGFIELLNPFLNQGGEAFLASALSAINAYTEFTPPSDDRSIVIADSM